MTVLLFVLTAWILLSVIAAGLWAALGRGYERLNPPRTVQQRPAAARTTRHRGQLAA